jgi:hypothetical protein
MPTYHPMLLPGGLCGLDMFYQDPSKFQVPPNVDPYKLSDDDFKPISHRPLLNLYPQEVQGTGRPLSLEDNQSLYFLDHPAIH